MKKFPLILLLLASNAFAQYTGAPSNITATDSVATITGLAKIDAIGIQAVDHGNLGADEDFSALLGYHLATLSANTTVTLSDFPAAPYVGSVTLDVFQDGTGGRTITWPAEVTYPPRINPEANSETKLLVQSFDGGASFVVRSSFAGTGIPFLSKSANYVFTLLDANGAVGHPVADNTARYFGIPPNATVPFTLGDTVVIPNRKNVVTLYMAGDSRDTLILAGTGAVDSVTIAADNIASAVKVAPTEWMVTGTSGLAVGPTATPTP